jgi:choline-sulfatase
MADRPNILLILTDEHAASVSGYAGDPVVQTQNLDRLAAEGMRL